MKRKPNWGNIIYITASLAIMGFCGSIVFDNEPVKTNIQEPAIKPYTEPYIEPVEPKLEYIGTYTVSGYCLCPKCCGKWSAEHISRAGTGYTQRTASGTIPEEGVTVGTDWDKLPKGTTIYIDGIGERKVEDKTADWINERYDGEIIDLLCESHEEALQFGVQKLDVWIVR